MFEAKYNILDELKLKEKAVELLYEDKNFKDLDAANDYFETILPPCAQKIYIEHAKKACAI